MLSGLRFPDLPVDPVGIFLVVTLPWAGRLLTDLPDAVPAEPREFLMAEVLDWAGLSLLRLLTLLPVEATVLPLLPVEATVLEDRLVFGISFGRPALKLLLTLDGTLLTMVFSTRRREKSVALTTVMPLPLFTTTVLLLITVLLITVLLGLFPCPQTLGDHPM